MEGSEVIALIHSREEGPLEPHDTITPGNTKLWVTIFVVLWKNYSLNLYLVEQSRTRKLVWRQS